LNSNAYLGSVYKDIGDHLMREFDPAGAWLFWDMGRALPNNTSASLLDKIAPFEQKLVEDYPDYY
jgi:hypothetical protein